MTPHEAFREWFNYFYTFEGFASYYDMTIEEARTLIEEGRKVEYAIGKGEA